MMIALSPIVPALMFAWYVVRHRLMPIVFERTLVYGGSLIAVVWLHHITISPLTELLEQRSRFDFVVLEVVLFVALVMAWRPLRERVSESLKYLLSSSVARVRDATRELSVQLSQRSSETPESLTRWLCESLRNSLQVSSVRIIVRAGMDLDVCSPMSATAGIAVDPELRQLLLTRHQITSEQLTAEQESLRQWMQTAEVGSVFRCNYRDVEGMVLVGLRDRSDRLSSEQRSTLGLLFDQFAAVLFNQQREEIRRVSERQAMQKEKLSVLGLLAGSLAHEIRNPLSSMKTIATLLAEDLAGRDGNHSNDVQMILSEIDRLTTTTQRLLESARPADDSHQSAEPDRVIQKLLGILGHLARQYGVEIQSDLNTSPSVVAATEATLSEIFFNLIRNAIEACQACSAPRVVIRTRIVSGFLEADVVDNGAGISPEVQSSLFQPFVTGKPHGTGLGLYIVSERVRELRGSISCRTELTAGTTFELRLPLLVGSTENSQQG
ncbi:MAG: ATP-binding protein [Planctomycetaceae bacterium]